RLDGPGPRVRLLVALRHLVALAAPGEGDERASLAPPLRDAPPSAAEGGPQQEVSAEEMRSIFGSFQRGLDRGRRGDSVGPDTPSTAPQAPTTDEGTDGDG
ncbi:histidine kinase, partial [Streptomyces sp. NPDC051098]